MADYLAKGNKVVYCIHGHPDVVPFQQNSITCSSCGSKYIVNFCGVIIDKHGNYVYK